MRSRGTTSVLFRTTLYSLAVVAVQYSVPPCYAHQMLLIFDRGYQWNDILALDLEDGLGQTTYVLAGDAGNRDTAVLGRVHGVLLLSAQYHSCLLLGLTSLARESICSGFNPV
jgi:hypothetical protein